MPHRILSLQQAAKHIRIPERELFHLVQRGEIPCVRRGDEVFFEHCQLDDWAQRHIMDLPSRTLEVRHREGIADRVKNAQDDVLVERLFRPEWIEPHLASRTKPAVLHDMVDLAVATGLLYDDVAFLREIEAREGVSSTAVEGGAAFLHARYHDPYLCEESFVVLGRTDRQIFFGAPDGGETDLFFLVCCNDDVLHLHTLARLCLLATGSPLFDELRAVDTADEMYDALVRAEQTLLRGL